tara:strand:+ start:124 stop:411 length:288 start_codon:yes stop_codon:yes gene_type:complete
VTVQAVNAHGLSSARRKSNGVRVCGNPVAGVVIEATPWQTIGWPYQSFSSETDTVGASPDTDRDHTSTARVMIRWREFDDDCAMGIKEFNVTLFW